MSLTTHNATLTTNARASGKKQVLQVIKDLDHDRQTWMGDLVIKSMLLGNHDTVRVQWIPVDEETRLKIIGTNENPPLDGVSTSTSSRGRSDEDAKTSSDRQARTDLGTIADGQETEMTPDPQDQEVTVKDSSQTVRATPRRLPYPPVKTESEKGLDDEMSELQRLRIQLERMEIRSRLAVLEQNAKVSATAAQTPTDKHHRGLFGLREEDVVENLINAAYGKQKTWLHPVSGREETSSEREIRMILYDMIVTSLVNFKSMHTGELVGDNYAIVRNVMKYGAPNSMRMKIDLTKRLGNYAKRSDQGYQEFELGLRNLVDELSAVGNPMPQDDITLRLIAGMMSDKRYEKECKEVSDQAEPYSTCHHVFMQRAQALGNLVSKKKDEEAHAATDRGGGGKGGKGGKGGRGHQGRGGKGGRGDHITRPTKQASCSKFLMEGNCRYGDECRYSHVSLEELKKRVKKNGDKPDRDGKSTKKKTRRGRRHKDNKEGESDDSAADGTTKKTRKKKSSEPCFSYQNTGSCPRGKKCRYSHGDEASDDDSAESSHVLEQESDGDDSTSSEEESTSSGTETETQSDTSDESEPATESILYAAGIGAGGKTSKANKITPIRGGRTTVSSLKQNTTKAHKKVSFSKSLADLPYHSGTVRHVEGRKHEVGENVEINLPGKPLLHGIRCLVIELWETHDDVPYAKLKPLIEKKVSVNILEFLMTMGVQVRDLKMLDIKQPEELSLSSEDRLIHAIIDSGATRTVMPNASYLVKGSLYKLETPLLFKGFDKKGKAHAATHGGTIALKSNTSMKGYLLIEAFILPTARRPLISMSQLDDEGCYVEMGGGGMRLRKGADGSNFLALPRLEPFFAKEYARDLQREYDKERDVAWDFAENEKSSLYPVPRNLFMTEPLDDADEIYSLQLGEKTNMRHDSGDEGEVNLATRYSEKEKLELRHSQLAHRSMLQLQMMMHWDGDGPRPQPHIVCWCAACVTAKAHAGTPQKKVFSNASRAPLDHVYADCSVDMGESAEGYKHFLCIFESQTISPTSCFRPSTCRTVPE